MTSHLATIAQPMSAVRVRELSQTGLAGRHTARRTDFRAEMRSLLSHAPGRHRRTFIPLDTYLARND
jgi:hypothetical protein